MRSWKTWLVAVVVVAFLVPAGLCVVMAIVFMVFFKDDVKATDEQIEAL